jgi:hypothetical protein
MQDARDLKMVSSCNCMKLASHCDSADRCHHIFNFVSVLLMQDATYIWVAGGSFSVGTETQPFTHQATITLHGDRWKTVELPFIGAKVLAVTNRGGLTTACHKHTISTEKGFNAEGPRYFSLRNAIVCSCHLAVSL